MPPIVLYLGGSHPQRIAVRSLVEAGFEVHVTDRDAAPPCAAETPYVHRIDATNVTAAVDLARSLAQRGRLVCAYGIADYAFRSVAAVNAMIGGPCADPSAVLTMIDKASTKEALAGSAAAMPFTLWAGTAASFDPAQLRYPAWTIREVIVKPAGVHASEGIRRVPVEDSTALTGAVAVAGRSGSTVLVEEFLSGDICNMDALVIEGRAYPVSMTRRIDHPQLAFLPSAQWQPARRDVAEFSSLAAMVQAVCSALGHRNGPITIDYIDTAEGPRVLEVSPHFHAIALEILRGNGNPLRSWVRYLAGDPAWQDDLTAVAEGAGALLMLRAAQTGILHSIRGEAAMNASAVTKDYIRLKQDGTQIRSLSAREGLLALAWLVTERMDVDSIRACVAGIEPCVAETPQGF